MRKYGASSGSIPPKCCTCACCRVISVSTALSTVTIPITCRLVSMTGIASRLYLETKRTVSTSGASAATVTGSRDGAVVSTLAAGRETGSQSRRRVGQIFCAPRGLDFASLMLIGYSLRVGMQALASSPVTQLTRHPLARNNETFVALTRDSRRPAGGSGCLPAGRDSRILFLDYLSVRWQDSLSWSRVGSVLRCKGIWPRQGPQRRGRHSGTLSILGVTPLTDRRLISWTARFAS